MPDKNKQTINLTIKNGIVESCTLFYPAKPSFEIEMTKTKSGDYKVVSTFHRDKPHEDFYKKYNMDSDELIQKLSGQVQLNHGYIYINGKEVSFKEMIKQLEKSSDLLKTGKSIGLNNSGVTEAIHDYLNIPLNILEKSKEIG